MRIFIVSSLFLILSVCAYGQPANSSAKPFAPTFSAVGMDGTTYDIEKLRGKVVVLNLWFVNCPNCLDEIRQLNLLVDEYKGNKDVVFLGLATNKKPVLQQFLARTEFKYQIIPDATNIIVFKFGDQDKNGEFNVAFPVHVVIDKEGRMVTKVQGIKGIEVVKAELKNQLPTTRKATE